MLDALRRMANGVRLMVTRGKVQRATLGARTFVQVRGLAGEVFNEVELLLPYGMTAVPDAGDVVLLQVLGSRDHKLALASDSTALRIADAQPTEFGFRDARGQQVVFRQDHLEITTPLAVTLNATGTVTINGGTVVLAGGGPAVARVGDTVTCPAGTGHITTGSTKVTSG